MLRILYISTAGKGNGVLSERRPTEVRQAKTSSRSYLLSMLVNANEDYRCFAEKHLRKMCQSILLDLKVSERISKGKTN